MTPQMFRSHKPTGVEEKIEVVKCGQHEEQVSQVYCVEESRPVCTLCTVDGCRAHTVKPIEDILVSLQNQLTNDLQRITVSLENIDSSIDLVEKITSGE